MSANCNALLNASAVATDPAVPAAVGTTGTHAAAAQGNAAAVDGAVAPGAVNVAAGTVATAAGSGTTAQDWPAAQSPVAFAPGNSSVPLPGTQPASVADQPAFPPDLSSANGAPLVRTDSATDPVEAQGNAEDNSAHMGGSVDDPFTQHVPTPLFVDPTQVLAALPSFFRASRPMPPIAIPGLLPRPPIAIPASFFALTVASTRAAVRAAAAANPEAINRAYNIISFRAKTARRDLQWEGPGIRSERAHARHTTPDDCQNICRFVKHRRQEDRNLLEAEARCAWNKNQQLILLQELEEQDLAKPPQLRENFAVGAMLDLSFRVGQVSAAHQLAAAQVASVASSFFPEDRPVATPLPPRSTWPVAAGAGTGLLKRKRDADDDPSVRPAKRARMKFGPESPLRFAFLRRLAVRQRPRPRMIAIAATHPGPLPYSGAAAYPVPYSMSDVATQTDEESFSPAFAGPSLTAAASASPLPAPPPRPRKGKGRRVAFEIYPEFTRPRRLITLPPLHMVGTEPTDEDTEDTAQQPVGDAVSRGMPTPEELEALRIQGEAASPAYYHIWSHPNDYVLYEEFSMQWPEPEPEPKPKPSPLPSPPPVAKSEPEPSPPPSQVATTDKKTYRDMGVGEPVQNDRALKEAATATEDDDDDKMVVD